MTLVEFHYLIAVAEERSFRRAAEKVFVSQPALSMAIARLEAELGVQLLERGKNEVSLTTIGAAVIAQARRVLDAAEGVKLVARQGSDPLAGPFRLGAIHTVAPYLLPILTTLVRQRLPGMTLSREEGGLTTELQARLERGELDAILIALPFEAASFAVDALYDEAFDVILPRGHELARLAAIDPAPLGRVRRGHLGAAAFGGHESGDDRPARGPTVSRAGAEPAHRAGVATELLAASGARRHRRAAAREPPGGTRTHAISGTNRAEQKTLLASAIAVPYLSGPVNSMQKESLISENPPP